MVLVWKVSLPINCIYQSTWIFFSYLKKKTLFLHCSYAENAKCNFGDKCTQAHSKEELNEWKERFKFRKQQIKIARDKHLHGNTYAEQLMEKLVNAENSKSIVSFHCKSLSMVNCFVTFQSKFNNWWNTVLLHVIYSLSLSLSYCSFYHQMTQNVEYAKIHVNSELKVNMTTKKCTNAWTFTITSKVRYLLLHT